MIKKVSYFFLLSIFIIFIYIFIFFDINSYKRNLEDEISKRANVDVQIAGNLDLDVGINTTVKASSLLIKKNNILLIEVEKFQASISLSKVLNGIYDIESLDLINSKLYGINIDESIIKAYNTLSGRGYSIKNPSYSKIDRVSANGYFEDDNLYIKSLNIQTELLEGNGFGKINPSQQTINISANTFVKKNEKVIQKYNQYFPKYLINTQLPILITGNYNNPDIDIKISEVIVQKLKEEIKTKAVESIKDKLREKIQSEINIKLPF